MDKNNAEANCFSETTFTIKSPISSVYENLLDIRKSPDWVQISGCEYVKQAIMISKSSSGIAIGQVLIGDNNSLCLIKIVETQKDELIKIQVHVAPAPIIPLTRHNELRDHCIENQFYSYKNDFFLERINFNTTKVFRMIWSVNPIEENMDFLHELIKLENLKMRNKWIENEESTNSGEYGIFSAVDLAAGSLVQGGFSLANGILDATTSTEGLSRSTKSLLDSLGAIGSAIYLPPGPPQKTSHPPTSPMTTSLSIKSEDDFQPPSPLTSKSNHNQSNKNSRRTSISTAQAEAVVVKKAKVRSSIETSSSSMNGGEQQPIVGTLAVGTVVVVLETALTLQGILRNKIKYTPTNTDLVPNQVELVGWVTADLLSPRRKEKSQENDQGDDPLPTSESTSHENPSVWGDDQDSEEAGRQFRRTIKRKISLQRPKHHAAL